MRVLLADDHQLLRQAIRRALEDAGMVDGKGRRKAGSSVKFRSDARREERADLDLMAAGIRPGDPSLYPETVEDVDPYGPPT